MLFRLITMDHKAVFQHAGALQWGTGKECRDINRGSYWRSTLALFRKKLDFTQWIKQFELFILQSHYTWERGGYGGTLYFLFYFWNQGGRDFQLHVDYSAAGYWPGRRGFRCTKHTSCQSKTLGFHFIFILAVYTVTGNDRRIKFFFIRNKWCPFI